MAFAQQVSAFVNLAKGNVDKSQRQAVVLLAQGVIMGNPVDTGRSRNGWNFNVGSVANLPVDMSNLLYDKSGAAALNRIIGQSQAFRPGTVAYMSNAVPYVPNLEFEGHSRQAPTGWIRATVTDLPRRLDEYLRGLA